MLSKLEFTKEVGKRIRHCRKKLGISQEELAFRCNLYRTYIGHLENGRYSPTAYVLWRISKVLGVSIDKLFP
jgi:transcriptional regulator with XRE-family HTH domain